MESEGEDGDPPPPYRGSEPTACGTETGATSTRMMTWTSATRRSPHPLTHRGDPAETHRDPLGEARRNPRAEDHQHPLEDAHPVDPPEAGPQAEEDPLDQAGPAEALLEDPLGIPAAHREMVSRRQPGGGSSTSAGASRSSSAR